MLDTRDGATSDIAFGSCLGTAPGLPLGHTTSPFAGFDDYGHHRVLLRKFLSYLRCNANRDLRKLKRRHNLNDVN